MTKPVELKALTTARTSSRQAMGVDNAQRTYRDETCALLDIAVVKATDSSRAESEIKRRASSLCRTTRPHIVSGRWILWFLLLSTHIAVSTGAFVDLESWKRLSRQKFASKPTMQRKKAGSVFRYNICNGLSNQLLYHAASMAQAILQNYEVVEIPNYFILNGVQTSDQNVLPNSNNSVPLNFAFESEHLLSTLKGLGIKGRLVSFLSNSSDFVPKCKGMATFAKVKKDPYLVKQVLDAFVPSKQHIQPIIQEILQTMPGDLKNGVCFHHRDGRDWHEHCQRWVSSHGVYRGNCLGEPDQSLLESLRSRALHAKDRWLYYCGDHEIPQELLSNYNVTSHATAMEHPSSNSQRLLQQTRDWLSRKHGLNHVDLSHGAARDFWALIDFSICRQMEYFVGNSVSTFSAIQIALHNGHGAYWYNSQSIPMQDFWKVYQIPIVYTYTELSAPAGKHLLQISIESVRSMMPKNRIHILYHGHSDHDFRSWLLTRNVTIHEHEPTWQNQIEEMRQKGKAKKSDLFLHSGNYLGTWQRIDIPFVLETEYVLLLDSDTIIRKPFTLSDFGLNLTYGLAMSSEMNIKDTKPSNAGVTLMNVPFLRRSYDEFLAFVLKHVESGGSFHHPSPSDQGAYLVFYKDNVRFLSEFFNFKPYWDVVEKDFESSYILHFHGPKPRDYVHYLMWDNCTKATKPLCLKLKRGESKICHSLAAFATASMLVGDTFYCKSSFPVPGEAIFCQELFRHLELDDRVCSDSDLFQLAWVVMETLPSKVDIPRKKMYRHLRLRTRVFWIRIRGIVGLLWLGVVVYAFLARSARKKRLAIKVALIGFLGASVTSVMFAEYQLQQLHNHEKVLQRMH